MRLFILLSHLVALIATSSPTYGQAFCALRDPIVHIYDAFPGATNYRSIVRTVDENTRRRIGVELPFTLSFNELGRHTLYVTTNAKGHPLGLVHVRSERGPWGLAEIAWSFDVNMRIVDFEFQRVRSSHRALVESDAFKQYLIGQSVEGLRALLSRDGKSPASSMGLPKAAQRLAATVLRSALKTTLVTQYAWQSDLELIRRLHYAYSGFPTAAYAEALKSAYSARARAEIDDVLGDGPSSIDRHQVVVIRLLDSSRKVLGHAVRLNWRVGNLSQVLWWMVGADGIVLDILPQGTWTNADVRNAFRAVEGMRYSERKNCATASMMVGAEVLILSQAAR